MNRKARKNAIILQVGTVVLTPANLFLLIRAVPNEP